MDSRDTDALFIDLPPRRLFLTAALPGAMSMLASACYDLSDGIMVGQLMGETAFAAVSLAMPFVIMVFAAGDMVGVGSSVPISISLGEGNRGKANNVFSCAVLLIMALGALMGSALFLAAPTIMAALGATGELASMAITFLRVYAACSPVTTLMFAVDNFLRICGRIRGSLCLNLFMAVFGAACEFSLLYFFRLGAFGAALGYCLSLMLSVLIGLLPFVRGRMQLRFVRPRLSRALLAEILASGTPAFLGNVAGRLVSVLLGSALLRVGGEQAVAVYGLLMYVGGVAYPLIYGMSDSLQPAIGYNWGAGRIDRVVKIEKWVIGAAAAIALVVVSLMWLVPDQLVSLFMADADEGFRTLARGAFRLYALAWVLRWLPMTVLGFLTALERPRAATLLSLLMVLAFPLLALVLLEPLGLEGLWLNEPAATVATAAVAAYLLLDLRRDLRGEKRGRAPVGRARP